MPRRRLADPIVQQDYPAQERKALEDYTLSSSINRRIADAQKPGGTPLDADDKKYVKNLDNAISKSGWNTTETNTDFVRGGGGICVGVPETMNFNSQQELADYINNSIVGQVEATNVGFTSITRTPSVAKGFASGKKNAIIMHYDRIEGGTRGAYVSGGKGKSAISVFGDGEDETLLERNITTRAQRAWVGNDGYVHVSVHIRPDRSYFNPLKK